MVPPCARRVCWLLFAVLSLSGRDGLAAQSVPTATRDSVARAVQAFYDWYVPRAVAPGPTDVVLLAATRGPLPFDSLLVHWLRVDASARARADGEVVGLDGDPYLNAQDPCEGYHVSAVRARGAELLVDVIGRGGCPPHDTPDVTVVLTRVQGRWTVRDFLDPNRDDDALTALLKRLHERPPRRVP